MICDFNQQSEISNQQFSSSLTTEYPANGSFSDHTHAVCMKLTHAAHSSQLSALSAVLKAEGLRAESFKRQFEFLMVKLLRAYGECLGARSR